MPNAVSRWMANWTWYARPAETTSEYHCRIQACVDEALARFDAGDGWPKINELETVRNVLEADPRIQPELLRAAFWAMCQASDPRAATKGRYSSLGGLFRFRTAIGDSWNTNRQIRFDVPKHIATRLFRKCPDLGSQDLSYLIHAVLDVKYTDFVSRLPLAALMQAIEDYAEADELSISLRLDIRAIWTAFRSHPYAELRKIAAKASQLLEVVGEPPLLKESAWSKSVELWLDQRSAAKRKAWTALLEHSTKAGWQSRPPLKWRKIAEGLVRKIGRAAFQNQLIDWLESLELDPESPDPNADIIRGLIWASMMAQPELIATPLGSFAERCFKKVPGWGAGSVKLGNAALFALGELPDAHGVAQLSRLKGKIRYTSARAQLEKALLAAAVRAGKSIADLEEIALPNFGLGIDGYIHESVGSFEAEIKITGSDTVALLWRGPKGKQQRSIPTAVKRDHSDKLKAMKARVKEIKEALRGQSSRIERLYLATRSWAFMDWQQRYLDHPLLSQLSRRLIWQFELNGQTVNGLFVNGKLSDSDGQDIDWLTDETTVTIWHPVDASADEVLAWRRRLESLQITQPFKQAHREIYILTDAERRTRTYSNRFAAHIIRQHQFRALCQQRGWRYDLQGVWDSHNIPQRYLEHWDFMAQFWVEAVDSEDLSDAFVFAYLVTDQVQFADTANEPIPLADVPPLVFSETMRDVDLFIGVTSVGNDPTWVDGGPDRRFLNYWRNYSFGDLSATAKTRREVLANLIPRLKIAEQCSVVERFMVVRGKRRTYKIHLGSANILMEPNDRYLCIVGVPKGGTGMDKVYLPFEGDNTLSLILSKAFLLAEDDKIEDGSILSQIR